MNELFIKRLDEIFLLEDEDAVIPFRYPYLTPDHLWTVGAGIITFLYDINGKKWYSLPGPQATHWKLGDQISDDVGIDSEDTVRDIIYGEDSVLGRVGKYGAQMLVTLWEPERRTLASGSSAWLKKPAILRDVASHLMKEPLFDKGAIWVISHKRSYTTDEILNSGIKHKTDDTGRSLHAGLHVMPGGKYKKAAKDKLGVGGRYSGKPLPKNMTQAEYRFLTTMESLDED